MISPLLKKTIGYIDGRWSTSKSSVRHEVINPANGRKLAEVPDMGTDEAVAAVESCDAALAEPAPARERRRWLLGISDSLLSHRDELGRIITIEHGKPLSESIAEVEYSAGFYRFCGEHLDHLESRVLEERPRGLRWTVHHRVSGVAGLISPWNFPLAMLSKKLSAALGAGCPSVTRPSVMTPLSAIALWSLMEELDIPRGMANLVIGAAGPIGDVLCTHPAVRAVSFTGSTEVGRLLATKTANHIKRLTMELGGNAPFLVFADADLETASTQLIANKFRAGGQTCVCSNRVYVEESVFAPFTEVLSAKVKQLRAGDGLEPDTDIGPLINRDAFDKVARHVRDALSHGSRRLAGADPARPEHDYGCFYPPTLLAEVTPAMMVCREETFGPVIAATTFENEEAAVEAANSTPYGLAAYLFTADPARAERIVPKLRFGHVGLNTGTGPTPEAPFGGMKESGYGREGGLEGMLEFCDTQVVAEG